jgi:hypothetical protein
MMRARTLIAFALTAATSFALAQSTGDAQRGSTPPGMSRDGGAPADGAIKGGSILPGESAGTPSGAAGGSAPERDVASKERCGELSGTLREQCARDAMREKLGSCDSLAGAEKERCEAKQNRSPK